MDEWKRRMAYKAVTQLRVLGLSSAVATNRSFCKCNGRRGHRRVGFMLANNHMSEAVMMAHSVVELEG